MATHKRKDLHARHFDQSSSPGHLPRARYLLITQSPSRRTDRV